MQNLPRVHALALRVQQKLRADLHGAGGMVYGHELQRHAHMLQSVWVACGVLVTSVSDHWSEKRSLLYWCAALGLPVPC